MALRTISKCLLRFRVHVVPLLHKQLVKLSRARIVVVGFKFLQTKEVEVGAGNLLFGRRSCRDKGAGITQLPCEVGV